jgi:hypothetical protein
MVRYKKLGVGVVVALAVVAVGVVGTLVWRADAGEQSETPYEIGLIGDVPYGDTGRKQLPALVADLNAHELAFTTFDGDIKNGKERCDQPAYDLALGNLNSLKAPVFFVPGDNEWTDCDRASNGSYDPNERLALVRRTFAAGSQSLGQHKLPLTRQSTQYPENIRWAYGQVTYIGLNISGSDNNAPQFDATGKQTDGDAAEYSARNAANLAWLDAGFAAAKQAKSVAVMVVIQADMLPLLFLAGPHIVRCQPYVTKVDDRVASYADQSREVTA